MAVVFVSSGSSSAPSSLKLLLSSSVSLTPATRRGGRRAGGRRGSARAVVFDQEGRGAREREVVKFVKRLSLRRALCGYQRGVRFDGHSCELRVEVLVHFIRGLGRERPDGWELRLVARREPLEIDLRVARRYERSVPSESRGRPRAFEE